MLALVALGGGFVYMRRDAELQRQAMALAHDKEMRSRGINGDASESKGALDIATTPAGCAIWINGDLRPETTPSRVDKLPFARELQIKLTKEGLEPHRESVTLSEALPMKAIVAEMNVGSVTVLLKIDPQPTVWLDGKPWKGDRARIDGLTAGEEHRIVVSASGYSTKTFSFTAQPGETKTFTEALPKIDPAALASSKSEETRSPGSVWTGPAKVRVGAKGGFCNVTVNGSAYGPTPVEAAVQSGTVHISCKPLNAPSMSQVISVGPGETGKVSFKVDP